MKNETQIKYPNCGTTIDFQDLLAQQLDYEIKNQT